MEEDSKQQIVVPVEDYAKLYKKHMSLLQRFKEMREIVSWIKSKNSPPQK